MPSINLSGHDVPTQPPVVYKHPPSSEQRAVLDTITDPRGGNIILDAVAGSGKTTTLVMICQTIPAGDSANFVAFNKKIAQDIQRSLYEAGIPESKVKASTFHAAGMAAWKRINPNFTVDPKKSEAAMNYLGVPKGLRQFVHQLASIAKQQCFGIGTRPSYRDHLAMMELVDHYDLEDKVAFEEGMDLGDNDNLIEAGIGWAAQLIEEHVRTGHSIIDFDDMIYMPLLREAPFYKKQWVLIDEAQDTNYMRREMSKRMLANGGRLIAVGDPHQAIYGFTGANSDALDLIQEDFHAERMPLSVSYRCAENIVKEAQRYVPHIQSGSRSMGVVRTIEEQDFLALQPTPKDAILCRNTKPLVQLAFGYLRRRVACHVEGREIGQGLIALATRWKTVKVVSDLYSKLDDYLNHETAKLLSQGKEDQLEGVRDRVETLRVILDHLPDDAPLSEVRATVDSMFKDTDGLPAQTITLSTVHKAKGREWETVYIYGRNKYMPSPFARQPWQLVQEQNLIYVAITRAKENLIYVNIPLSRG